MKLDYIKLLNNQAISRDALRTKRSVAAELVIDYADIEIGEHIGTGGFGSVFKVFKPNFYRLGKIQG